MAHSFLDSEDVLKQQVLSVRIVAMNILAGREHSIVELRHKLHQKLMWRLNRKQKSDSLADSVLCADSDSDFKVRSDSNASQEALIETVLAQLLDDNLLNEKRFTECFIRSRIAKGSGPIKIRHELMKRGIPNDLISDFLDESVEFWQQHIKKVHDKRFGDCLPDNAKEQNKRSRFLYQRGFSGELIRLFL